MAGYIRQSSFSDGDTITAALFNNEYNQLLSAFSNTSGHAHDGTTAEGPVIGLIGDAGETSPNNKVLIDTTNNYIEFYVQVSSSPVQQLYIADGAIVPVTDNDIDLGTSSLEFKDAYFDGTVTTDLLTVSGTTNLDGAIQVDNTITVGVDDTGYDVKFFGDTASAYMLWDASADDLVLAGAAGIDLAGDIDVDGTANLDNTDIDGTLAVDGTTISLDATTSLNIDNSNTSNGITIGTATSGVPISIGHTTSEVTVNDNLTVTGTLTLGSNAELTEAELEMLDGITAGTVAASKAVVVDSNKDAASFRNITLTGELDAATLDLSGNADIDGTLEADAITVDGTALNEYIADTVGAMVGSNTESGITVAYEDGDNTLDFTVGTLNQDTTGTADNITISANNSTDETVYPIFVDGATGSQGAESDTGFTYNPSSGLLTISGELDAGSLDISGNADIDGTLEADVITVDGTALNEYIADTVGAMVGSNTETGITVTYEDGDNTLDFVIGTLNQDTTGNAATFTASANNSTDETVYPIFVDGATGSQGAETDTGFTYNPSSGLLTIAGELDAGSLDISGNADIDGTTNLDAVDIDGAVQIDNTVTVGVDDTGYDVKFFGATASAYMLWDESVDDLILAGAARVVVPDGQLVLGSTAVSSTAAELNILDGKAFLDEDDLSSNSATGIASQQSIKAYVDTNAGSMTSFQLEDDDGTEVAVSNAKEVKFIGSGITTNWTDTDNGTDGDPYDLTFTVDAAQTGITSLLATDIKIGEDDQTKIDFETVNQINFYADNTKRVTIDSTGLTVNSGSIETATIDYTDGDNAITIADGGKVTFSAAAVGKQHEPSAGSSLTPDFDTYQHFLLDANANFTLSNPSTENVGQSGVFMFSHNGGARTLSIGTQYMVPGGGTAITLSTGGAGVVDIIPYYVYATDKVVLGKPQLDVKD
tara:strand:+ start:52895 stop:55714 length:2820 start_codon:yes stop_codon:yes gene_type:complete